MPEITKTHFDAAKMPFWFWAIFFALTVFVYFFGLSIPLVGPDEPRYAQVAREMFERGDWITPTLGGHNWFEKPALLYWLEIASYHIFGVTEFAARFGSAIFGLGTIASVWLLGRTVNRELANWAALTAATSIGLMAFSRGASFDIILTFPLTAALAGYFTFERRSRVGGNSHGRTRLVPLVLFYFFIGVALLAKGLVGILFPVAIVALYHLISWRRPDSPILKSLIWGIPLSLAIASIWYVPMYLRYGYAFVDEFFIQHHFQRYTSNKYFHPQPFYFFFWVLPLMTIPWLPFFLATLWALAKRMVRRDPGTTEDAASAGDRALLRFCFAWLAVPIGFFSFSGSKLPGYVLPALPAAMIITGHFVWKFALRGGLRRATAVATPLATYTVAILLLIFVVPDFARNDSVKELVAAADRRGFGSAPVLSLHTISHNAEFYAAGRIVRAEDGKQRKFLSSKEILRTIREGGQAAVVFVPPEYLNEVIADPELSAELLGSNGELVILAVSEKK